MQRWFDILRLRLRSIFRRDSADRELDRELRFHLEEHLGGGLGHQRLVGEVHVRRGF